MRTQLDLHIQGLGLTFDSLEKMLLKLEPSLAEHFHKRSISQRIRRACSVDAGSRLFISTKLKDRMLVKTMSEALGLEISDLKVMSQQIADEREHIQNQINAHRQTILFLSQEIMNLHRQMDEK